MIKKIINYQTHFSVRPVVKCKIFKRKKCYLNFQLKNLNFHSPVLFLGCVLCLAESIVFAIQYSALLWTKNQESKDNMSYLPIFTLQA